MEQSVSIRSPVLSQFTSNLRENKRGYGESGNYNDMAKQPEGNKQTAPGMSMGPCEAGALQHYHTSEVRGLEDVLDRGGRQAARVGPDRSPQHAIP